MKKSILFIAMLLCSFAASATTHNVSSSLSWWVAGSDSPVQAGDTLLVADGEYVEQWAFDISKAGLVIMAAEGAKPVIKASSYMQHKATTTFIGITFDGQNKAEYTTYSYKTETEKDLIFINCEFKNYTKSCVTIGDGEANVRNLLVDGCTFDGGSKTPAAIKSSGIISACDIKDSEIKGYDYNLENSKKYLEKIKSIKKNIETNSKEETNSNNDENIKEQLGINNKNEESKEEFNLKEELKSLNFRIVVNKENRERVKAAYIIRENLNEIGIKSIVEELEMNDLSSRLDKKEYDLALIGWELPAIPDATEIIRYSGYEDEKLNSYLQSLVVSTNKNNTASIYKAIQKYTRDKVAFISLGITDDYLVTNKRISGELSPNDFDIYEGIYQIGLEK
jgi:hypothetical protein